MAVSLQEAIRVQRSWYKGDINRLGNPPQIGIRLSICPYLPYTGLG